MLGVGCCWHCQADIRYDSYIGYLQTTIEAEGFRSLREGEDVEFVIEPSEDNRFKAIKVTGPGGAPPQVQSAAYTYQVQHPAEHVTSLLVLQSRGSSS